MVSDLYPTFPSPDNSRYAHDEPLDAQETIFVEALFSNGLDYNLAKRAADFPKRIHVSRILARPHVNQAIHERAKAEKVGVPELLEMRAKLARSDIRDLYTIKEWDATETTVDEDGNEVVTVVHHKEAVPDLVRAIESGNSYIIKGIEHNRDGSVKRFIIEDRAPHLSALEEMLGLTNHSRLRNPDHRSYAEKIRESGMSPQTVEEELEALLHEVRRQRGAEVYDATGAPADAGESH